MIQFDIIATIKAYALSKGWVFIYGNDFEYNYQLTKNDISTGKYILSASFSAEPKLQNNRVVSINYSGVLFLGQKSGLDETTLEKYESDYLVMVQLLMTCIADLNCQNLLTVSGLKITTAINRFDENIDTVTASLTFEQ